MEGARAGLFGYAPSLPSRCHSQHRERLDQSTHRHSREPEEPSAGYASSPRSCYPDWMDQQPYTTRHATEPTYRRQRGGLWHFGKDISNALSFNQANHTSQTPPYGHRPDVQLESLNRDLEALIASARNDFANSPFNPTSQQRLKALLDLQRILQSQQLPPDQLKAVRDQLATYAVPPAPAQNPAPAPPAPVPTPPTLPASQPLSQLLNSETLAGLLKATAGNQQPTPPPQFPTIPQMPTTSTPQPAENPLIAALRLRGLLPSASAPPSLASGTPPMGGSLPFMIPGHLQSTPPASTPQASTPSSSTVPMNTASMKM